MEHQLNKPEPWNASAKMWMFVTMWFSASLLSQSVYLARYGLPYDAVTLLKSLGPLYYAMVLIETSIWIFIIGAGVSKVFKLDTHKAVHQQTESPLRSIIASK